MADSDSPYRTISLDLGIGWLGITVVELTASSGIEHYVQSTTMTVYVAYAETAQRQHYLTLEVERGTTIYEALTQTGWLIQFTVLAEWCEEVAELTIPVAKLWHVGVYAQKQPLNYQLQPFDRIEIYRSLNADPMSQRKSKSI